jgi:Voltage gated chloride channel
MGGGTAHLPSAPLDDHSRTGAWVLSHRADHAMQYRTPAPDEHSSEEIIRSYHEHQGDIDMKPFWWKLLGAITTVGSGGSAALEGPSIYGGGAVGSWLWGMLERLGLDPRDRRLMLISGAGAGLLAARLSGTRAAACGPGRLVSA